MNKTRVLPVFALVLPFCVILAGAAAAQCILANPSFEISGSGGAVFGGWSQFGSTGSVTEASHGQKAALLRGPDYGGWDVSAYWQSQDCEEGEQWEASGSVRHTAGNPLTAQCTALVNIEWRDAAGGLISYDTFTVADASSPTDEYFDFFVASSAAPSGTTEARFLVGVLQSPGAPSPDVYYDQVTFYSTSYPTIDDVQWSDFPGGNTVEFGGYTWRIKGPGYYGPGPNLFCDSTDCVWVDDDDRLHLTLQNDIGPWYSTEVVTEEALGYGDYIMTTVGALDLLDPQCVLGMFLWEYGPCWDSGYLWWNAFNEIDIEYSRWEDPGRDIAQFVAQPYDWYGNISRFDAVFGADEVVSHAMKWLPDRVEYRVWRGGPEDEATSAGVHSWTYTGYHIPRPEQPRMHLNLWKIGGTPASTQEVVFQDFIFVPEGGMTDVGGGAGDRIPAVPSGRLYPATPNPFNPSTTIRFALSGDGIAEISVYDVTGARVRILASRFILAGEHTVEWDGRDDDGMRLASGVYLCQLRTADVVETQRMVLVK